MATVVSDRALHDTRIAFDGVAATYDRSNAENPLLCAMRDRTRAALVRAVPRGLHILNLGCGPGTDDVYFASRGYRVFAIDWSVAMVDEARRRVRDDGWARQVRVEHLGIDQLDQISSLRFDAAYSSFGPLNCVADLDAAAASLARCLRPGAIVVASVIGRVCPWELALYLAKGRWARALTRFSREPVAVPLEGRTVWTRYFTPGEVARVFADAGFAHVSTRALGLLTPPPYMQAFAGRHRTLVARLQQLEDAVGDWPGVRAWGDHFLIELRRA